MSDPEHCSRRVAQYRGGQNIRTTEKQPVRRVWPCSYRHDAPWLSLQLLTSNIANWSQQEEVPGLNIILLCDFDASAAMPAKIMLPHMGSMCVY